MGDITRSEWLTIVAIIIAIITIPMTFLAGMVAVLFQNWLNQPNANPDEKKPKNLIQRIGDRLIKVAMSPRLNIALIVLNLAVLVTLLVFATEVSKLFVFMVSSSLVGIYFNMQEISIAGLNRKLGLATSYSSRQQLLLAERLLTVIEKIANVLESLSRIVFKLSPDEKEQPFMTKLLKSVKELVVGEKSEITENKQDGSDVAN